MKKISFILLLISFVSFSQNTSKLNIFTFEEIEKLQIQNQKPVLVFVYTDWCKICFGMKKTTFQNKEIQTLLNVDFYVVFFNAETEKEITFFEKSYRKTSGKIHELATVLAKKNKQLIYPTTVVLNKNFQIDLQIQGFINGSKLKSILELFLLKNQ